MTKAENLAQIKAEMAANGITPKITILKAKAPRKGETYANRIKGGSTRVRCNGGSHSTNKAGKNSALADVG